ncbi:hypothetical protein NUH88_22120 [Nisaea acidiphila]|uniref:Prolyl 4-hydroxylase alpha subunit Fe(2+) 2OG dioxygenase domain-containing protein n=1 Tax=Nisaea acidiphila TaxID=1862145 RepID=A0A9J7AUS1_9PROT|nr:hypothetical protein [Nisaea acidiphila]UUX50068.1 hypothetical protein NUH88_22120 [Nisaea acidiphila]
MSVTAAIDRDSILESVLNSEVRPDPFEHAIVERFFSIEDLAAIKANWPEEKYFEPLSAIKDDKYPKRRELRLEDQHLELLPTHCQDFWRGLRDALCSPAFAKVAFGKFQSILAPRINAPGSGNIVLDLRLLEDQSSYELGPHTDIDYKLLTLLIYLPDDDSLSEFGTSLYEPKFPDRQYSSSGHHARDEFELVGTVPFLPNTVFMFPRTDRSFHGVETFAAPQSKRKLIVYNIYLR